MSLNRVALQGRLVSEPELRHTQSEVPVANLRLAVDRDFKDKESGERQADFFNLTAWRHTAEFVCKYFQKGDMMIVDGKIQNNTYTDKDGNNRVSTNIVVENCYFGGSSSRNNSEGGYFSRKTSESSASSPDVSASDFTDITDSESDNGLPF